MPIPVESLDALPKPKPKNSVGFKDVQYERPKEGIKNRLKVTLRNDEKSKPHSWLFIMNSRLVDRWIEELDHFRNYPLDNSPAVRPNDQPIGELPKPPASQLLPEPIFNQSTVNPVYPASTFQNYPASSQQLVQSSVLAPPNNLYAGGSKVEQPAISKY